MVAELGTCDRMMNSPILPGMQAGQSGENVACGRNQGLRSSPMLPTRVEAGCAGSSNNVPIPPSTPSSRGNQDGLNLGGVTGAMPNVGGGFGPQQNLWGGFMPQSSGNVGNLAGSANAGNLMQGNLASSFQSGGPPPGMWHGAGVNPSWMAASNPVGQSNCCSEARQFGPNVGGVTPQVSTYQEILRLLPQLGTHSLVCCSSW